MKNKATKNVVCIVVTAFALWSLMFAPWTAPYIPFWLVMTAAALIMTIMVTCFQPRWWKNFRFQLSDVFWGIGIAAAMWGVFWMGDKLSRLMFNFARPEVDAIYCIKDGWSPVLVSCLLLFIIGPAEEIVWRGFVQKTLSERFGGNAGLIIGLACYTLIHVMSLNFMLIMAALVAGAVWGVLYRFFPQRFGAIILSHALWDAAVFVWFPIL